MIGVTDKNKLMYSTVMICIHSINTYTVIHRDVLYRLLSLGIDNKAKTNLFSCYLVGFIYRLVVCGEVAVENFGGK